MVCGLCSARSLPEAQAKSRVTTHASYMSETPSQNANDESKKITVMKYGDHCWLKDLKSSQELNGNHVRLEKWVDEKQRWLCSTIGWTYSEEFIGVKPRNLSSEPPTESSMSSNSSCAAGSSFTNGVALATAVDALMKRYEELRGDVIRVFNAKCHNDASLEACLRLSLCEVDMLDAQLKILLRSGSKDQVKQAKINLDKIREAAAAQLKQWRCIGREDPDYWDSPVLVNEALLQSDVNRYREALSVRACK